MSPKSKTKQPAATSAAIVRVKQREYQGLSMAFAPAEAKRRLQELQAFVQEVMVEGVDYMKVGQDKADSLLQPGAQKLAELYGFYHRFVDKEIVKDWERGFFYFEYRCELFSRRDDSRVGEGIGSCNSREAKYAGRWVPRKDVPHGMKLETLQTRRSDRWVFKSELRDRGIPEDNLEMQWRDKKGGGGSYPVFKLEDETFFVPNPDPFSLVNTLQKMGAKRSYVHAVIGATRSAGLFTQDIEDLPPEALGKPEDRRQWEKPGEVQGEVVAESAKPKPTRPKPAAPDPHSDVEPQDAIAKASPPSSVVDSDPSPEQLENFRDMMRGLIEAQNLEQLGKRWTNTKAARDHGLITPEQRKRLGEIKDRRKAALEAPPADSTDDGNEALGIAPAKPVELSPEAIADAVAAGLACFHCKKPVGSDGVEMEGPDGALVKKHPPCTAFGEGSFE